MRIFQINETCENAERCAEVTAVLMISEPGLNSRGQTMIQGGHCEQVQDVQCV